MSDNQEYLDKVATATNESYWAHMYDIYGWAFIGGAVIVLFGAFLCCRWICQPKDIYKNKKPKLTDDFYDEKQILPVHDENVENGMQPAVNSPVQVGQSPQPMFPVAGGGMSPKIQISPISPKPMVQGMYPQGMPQFQGAPQYQVLPQYQNQQQLQQMQQMQMRRASGMSRVSGVPNSHFFPAVPYPTTNLKVPNQPNFQQKVSIASDQHYIPTSMVDSVFANEGISMAPGAKKATEDRQKAMEVMKKEEGEKKDRIKERLAKARKESSQGNSNLASMNTLPANNLLAPSSMTFLQRVNALKTDGNRKLEEEKEDDLESIVSKAKLSNLSKASSILMSANVVKSTETLLEMGK